MQPLPILWNRGNYQNGKDFLKHLFLVGNYSLSASAKASALMTLMKFQGVGRSSASADHQTLRKRLCEMFLVKFFFQKKSKNYVMYIEYKVYSLE